MKKTILIISILLISIISFAQLETRGLYTKGIRAINDSHIGNITYDSTYWDDVLVDGSIFSFPGAADPSAVSCNIGGSGLTLELYEFEVNDEAYFTVQVPHNVKLNSTIYPHVHWYNGTRGNEEGTATVGWKVIWQIANINAAYTNTATTTDCSDANIATDYTHNISGGAGTATTVNISSYIVGKVTRTDTGTDDTWATNTSGNLPLLLGVVFHYEIDTPGSKNPTSK